MSGHVVLDSQKLSLAFQEVSLVRQALPQVALVALATEVVKRVAENLLVSDHQGAQPSPVDIDTLSAALLSPDDGAAIAFIEQAQKLGASYDVLCQRYLTEAARKLGAWWEDDKVSFYHVTIAAGRIYAILRILRLQRQIQLPNMRWSAIFATVPGENHTLGITVAADIARDRGWDIELLVGHSHEELVEALGQRDTPLIGLSAGSRKSLPALIRLIVALRISNPAARILVCGQIAAMNINLEGITGADAASADFEAALGHMARLAAS